MNRVTNQLQLLHLNRILRRVNAYGPAMEKKSDTELQGETWVLKKKLRGGASEEALLPEAYAAIREACMRVLGIKLRDVQVLGGIALYEGRIVEMLTGEGKTFTALMPLYLGALTGKSAILVTVNEYLACRDAKILSPVYEFMGLTVGVGVKENPRDQVSIQEKKEIYGCDIVYTTSGALGFDYLLQNLQVLGKNRFLPPFHYCILDEADSILLDAAQIPLIISGSPKEQSNLFAMADYFVSTLMKGQDYVVDEDAVWLTEQGMDKAQRFFRVESLYTKENHALVRHINLALRAHMVFLKDKQYVVEGDAISLLDANTGRIAPNTKLQAGQHQALEAKEHLKISLETRAMASITFQDLFNCFPRLAGMTGTAREDAAELQEIYGLGVVCIPPNVPIIRRDWRDLYFTNREAMLEAVMIQVRQLYARGQPILLITGSISMSHLLSTYLMREGIPHNVLNAYHVAKEAQIIAEAGRRGAVTVATAMAGRGTDIVLGPGAEQLGGLAVLGVGRMENRRLEWQARGRSGRQGDPGESRFYVSLDDTVVQEFGRKWLGAYRKEKRLIRSSLLKREVLRAQTLCEEQSRSARRATLMYGESIRLQREMVYKMRDQVLEHPVTDIRYYLAVERNLILEFLSEKQDTSTVVRYCLDNINYNPETMPGEGTLRTHLDVLKYLMQETELELKRKMALLNTDTRRVRFFQTMTLRAIDEAWIDEVDYLQQLRRSMSGRKYTMHNVTYEYHLESYEASKQMQKRIREGMMRNILLGEIILGEDDKMQVVLP